MTLELEKINYEDIVDDKGKTTYLYRPVKTTGVAITWAHTGQSSKQPYLVGPHGYELEKDEIDELYKIKEKSLG